MSLEPMHGAGGSRRPDPTAGFEPGLGIGEEGGPGAGGGMAAEPKSGNSHAADTGGQAAAPPVKRRKSVTAEANAEHIIRHLNEYLSVRFDHASRINPKLSQIKDDLIYHEIASVRRCLLGEKIYGIHKMSVADVFMSDDEKKRRNLMSPTDQTSIQVELVSHCQDEKVESTRGQIKIHDIKAYYASIDAGLSAFMDLIETWIWWDIVDAAELSRFEQRIGAIKAVCEHKITPAMQQHYNRLIHPPEMTGDGEAATQQIRTARPEEIVKFELEVLDEILRLWAYRRVYELGHMFVLKRDEQPRPDQGEFIQKIAGEIREIDRLEAHEELSPEDRGKYAAVLGMAEEKVTRETVLGHLKSELVETEREMLAQADQDRRLGPPYNYKVTQMERLRKWLGDLHRQLDGYLKKHGLGAGGAESGTAGGGNHDKESAEARLKEAKAARQATDAALVENAKRTGGAGEPKSAGAAEKAVSLDEDVLERARKKTEGGGDAASMWEEILNDE